MILPDDIPEVNNYGIATFPGLSSQG